MRDPAFDKGMEATSAGSPEQRTQVSGLPTGLGQQLERRTFGPGQVATRKQWAGAPLIEVPDYVLTLVATGNNQVFPVDLPDSLQVVAFRALSTVDFAVGFGGQIVMPQATGPRSGDFVARDGLVSPLDMLFYCAGLRSLYVGIAASGAKVSIVGWTQLG